MLIFLYFVINNMMFDFKEWYYDEIRHTATNPQVKTWIDAADKLHQTLEKLKAILKTKKPTEKPEKKPVKKPVEPKNVVQSTKVEKKEKGKGLNSGRS